MGQTRRFAESICKLMLGEQNVIGMTFDDMLATLKDKTHGEAQEKEFIDDLYYLKQQGNTSLHSSTVKQDGVVALECLKRSFEVAINYCVYTCGQSSDLLSLQYDLELMITGRKNQKLSIRYEKEKSKVAKKSKKEQLKNKPLEPYTEMKPLKSYSKGLNGCLVALIWLIAFVLLMAILYFSSVNV